MYIPIYIYIHIISERGGAEWRILLLGASGKGVQITHFSVCLFVCLFVGVFPGGSPATRPGDPPWATHPGRPTRDDPPRATQATHPGRPTWDDSPGATHPPRSYRPLAGVMYNNINIKYFSFSYLCINIYIYICMYLCCGPSDQFNSIRLAALCRASVGMRSVTERAGADLLQRRLRGQSWRIRWLSGESCSYAQLLVGKLRGLKK